MKFTNKQLDIMHEYVKNMDGYNIIFIKGQIAHYMSEKGSTREEVLTVLGDIGDDIGKARNILNNLKLDSTIPNK